MKWRPLLVWGVGFLCSCLFIWMVSAVFSNGIIPVEWDDELGVFVSSEGTVVRFRSEGWSDTRVGKHGLTVAGEAVLNNSQSKFIFWGDSYAEALQVEDSLRVANLYNAIPGSMKAFTVAGGGLGVADYYFNIPRYENLSENIDGHVILLTGLDDIMPGNHVECHSRFLTDPWRFEESACEPSNLALRYAPLARLWRLEPLYAVYRFFKRHNFRFAPGNVGADEKGQKVPLPNNLDQAWTFLVKSLTEQTPGFIVFAYVPPVPALKNGVIVTRNPEEDQKEQFRRICEALGVGFVDLSKPFFDLYAEHGQLSRGFFNSPPDGHLNEDGQRLIAEALHDYFKGEK